MNNKLSHSSLTMYSECSRKYELHYVEKIRAEVMGSPLFFGSAIDKALEYALKNPLANERSVKAIFLKAWRWGKINNNVVHLLTSPFVKYNKSDVDPLLSNNPWHSLRIKGYLMIEAFFRDIKPNITEVVSTQEEIALTNDNGDSITGFVDAVLKWKSHPDPFIFDFKTSSRPYKQTDVKESPQLTLYKHAVGTKYKTNSAGFIVFLKQLDKGISKICKSCKFDGSGTSHKTCNNEIKGKRCGGEYTIEYTPFVKTQVLIDDIDEKFEEQTLERFDNFNNMVQSGIYEPNWDSCMGKYGLCTYARYCKGGDMTGLTKIKNKDIVK